MGVAEIKQNKHIAELNTALLCGSTNTLAVAEPRLHEDVQGMPAQQKPSMVAAVALCVNIWSWAPFMNSVSLEETNGTLRPVCGEG